MTVNGPTVAESVRSMNDFTGSTVLVTGGCGQLGRTFCAGFKEAGAKVIAADIAPSSREDSAWDEFIEMDTTSLDSVNEVFEKIEQDQGRLDVLINNAGIAVFEYFENRTEEDLDRVFDVNVKGTFWCIRNFAKLAAGRGGRIVNIASLYGVVSPDPRIYSDLARHSPEIYGATKASVMQMTKYFAVHLAEQNIRVNAVSPGGVYNPENPQGPEFIEHYTYRCPMGRMANQEDMVGGVLFLASDAARYVNGHNLIIDGGFTAW
jgi:3-oxoacyl-[acyl-carrier protein] reductase